MVTRTPLLCFRQPQNRQRQAAAHNNRHTGRSVPHRSMLLNTRPRLPLAAPLNMGECGAAGLRTPRCLSVCLWPVEPELQAQVLQNQVPTAGPDPTARETGLVCITPVSFPCDRWRRLPLLPPLTTCGLVEQDRQGQCGAAEPVSSGTESRSRRDWEGPAPTAHRRPRCLAFTPAPGEGDVWKRPMCVRGGSRRRGKEVCCIPGRQHKGQAGLHTQRP